METKIKTDQTAMEKGVSQLLGYTPYKAVEPELQCDHLPDEFTYGIRGRFTIRKCSICGVFYDELID